MATELKQFTDEEKLMKKVRQKKRIRGCLIAANVLLLSYFSYLVVDSVVKEVKERNASLKGEIIALNGLSTKKSEELYQKYISSNVDINDFSVYGKYLLTSKSRVDYSNVNFSQQVQLVNLIANPFVVDSSLKFTLGNQLNEQINLFNLKSGDYMLCTTSNLINNKFICYHYTGVNLLETTIYSFPDENNHRKKITIKGKDSSPAIIISVEDINLLPADYYDFVIVGNQEEFDVFKNTSYQVKYVSSISEAYSLNSSYALNLVEGEDVIISSNYVNLDTVKPEKITSSVYQNLDVDNAIRELGGYVFNAGYGVSSLEVDQNISDISLEIKKLNKEVRNGKFTLTVSKDITIETIEDLLDL